MNDQTPNAEAKVGRFIVRLAAAACWFVVFWLVRFRTVGLEISDIMRTGLAILSLFMGMLTLYWAFFNKNDPAQKGGNDSRDVD